MRIGRAAPTLTPVATKKKKKSRRRKPRRKSAARRDVPSAALPFLDHIAGAARVVDGYDDPEGPHQVRVGLRKLRTALSVFGRHRRKLRPLRDETRAIAGLVGELRDIDVVRLEIVAPFAAAHPGLAGLDGLDRALQTVQEAERGRVRAMLESGRLDAALAEARRWLRRQRGRNAAKAADKALRRRFRKARRYARVFADLDEDHRHEFRKELKKLRYTLDCGAWPGGGPRRKVFVRRLKALQNTLGTMNDAVTAETVLRRAAGRAGLTEAAAANLILDDLAARSQADQERTAKLWADFASAAPDWV